MPELAKPYFQSVKKPDTDNSPLVLSLLWNWNILHNQAWNSPSGAIIWNTEYANALQDIPAVQKSCLYYQGRFRLMFCTTISPTTDTTLNKCQISESGHSCALSSPKKVSNNVIQTWHVFRNWVAIVTCPVQYACCVRMHIEVYIARLWVSFWLLGVETHPGLKIKQEETFRFAHSLRSESESVHSRLTFTQPCENSCRREKRH